MATESIKAPLQIAYAFADESGLHVPFLNEGATTIYPGQEVFISGDQAVTKRTTGATLPIGVCTIKAATNTETQVGLAKTGILQYAKAIGSAVTAGVPLKPNGNVVLDADGNVTAIEYVLAVSGDVYMTVATADAAQNAVFKALQLPFYTTLA